jgi:hypothetical protein
MKAVGKHLPVLMLCHPQDDSRAVMEYFLGRLLLVKNKYTY